MEKCFWAKKSEKSSGYYWLPLYQHLEDTKNVMCLLWNHWLSENQRNIVEGSIVSEKESIGIKIASFIGATHDIGKATFVFQAKRLGYTDDLDIQLTEKLERAGFKDIYSSYNNLSSPEKSHHSIAGQYLLSKYGVKEDISSIIGGHHGKPVDYPKTYKNQSAYESNLYQYNKASLDDEIKKNTYQKWKMEQENILNSALEVSGFSSVDELPQIKQPGQVILYGLLIMADWIASNEEYFPLFKIDEKINVNGNERMEIGYSKWEKSGLWNFNYSTDYENLYEERFGFTPNEVQKALSEAIDNSFEPGIFILEASMGVGKTEAALIASEQLAEKIGMGGIFFGLPTQATSDSMFPRVLKWLKSIQQFNNENMQIRLVHGNAALNEEYMGLATSINQDQNIDSDVIINHWFSGKKTSALDDFVIGTVDYFLMLSLKQKHLALRHLGFSKKIIIIDEVHAYDSYMTRYLLESIEWMGAYNVPIIILSATLPSERRLEMIKAYLKGKGKRITRKVSNEIQKEIYTLSYPLVTYTDGIEVKQVTNINIDDNTKKDINIINLEEENLLEKAEDMLSEGGVAGIIVNTVKRAQELSEIFIERFGTESVELLHSNFISTDRVKKEKKILLEIGKNANRPNKRIVIGTQVIEQSLDIDFDVMISDLAPVDLLIQRMGRLHRHNIKRPKKLQRPMFFVLGINDEFDFHSGSKYVYGDYLLIRTQHYLPNTISLPEDISVLVEKVYGNDDINIGDSYKDHYEQAKEKYFIKLKAKKSKADNYKLEAPNLGEESSNENNLIGWLSNLTQNQSDLKSFAQVRDIDETLEVIALKRVGSGYGTFEDSVDISKNIGDFGVDKNLCRNTIRLPKILSLPNKIDETIAELEAYRKRYLKSWDNSFWLQGELAIIFDENKQFNIFDYILEYDENLGLSILREEELDE